MIQIGAPDLVANVARNDMTDESVGHHSGARPVPKLGWNPSSTNQIKRLETRVRQVLLRAGAAILHLAGTIKGGPALSAASGRGMSIVRDGEPSATSEIGPEVTALIYELLDAHADTVELAGLLQTDTRWRVHFDYLTDLQRTGREMLAQKHHEVRTDDPSRTLLNHRPIRAGR